ncbi:MAG: general secretion pathway protein GspK [Longimicrobiales bacterium]
MSRRPGVALMLVLWLIVVLGTIGSGVVLSTRSTVTLTANYRARVVARYAAESGNAVARAALEDSLGRITDGEARRRYLNQLERALPGADRMALGDAQFAIALIDVGSRVDVNRAGAAALTTLFSYFTDAIEAERVARLIRAFIDGGMDQGSMPITRETPTLQAARPLRSLDELLRIPGVPRELAERAAAFLTVDGDGTINRATASDTVLAAAGGELRDEPSRIVIVSRGWLDGHPLTHEIQAVYAVVANELTLVSWRERDL